MKLPESPTIVSVGIVGQADAVHFASHCQLAIFLVLGSTGGTPPENASPFPSKFSSAGGDRMFVDITYRPKLNSVSLDNFPETFTRMADFCGDLLLPVIYHDMWQSSYKV